MCIRFFVACCLLTPTVMVSAQGYPGGACDGHCQHSHPPTGPALDGTNPGQLSARMYADEYRSRGRIRYDALRRSRMMGAPRHDQYRAYGNADGFAPQGDARLYADDPNPIDSREEHHSHRRHSHNGDCRHDWGVNAGPPGQLGQGAMNPGTGPRRFAAPGNQLQAPSDQQYLEQPSLPPTFPQASPQIFRQNLRSLPLDRAGYLNI